MAASVLGLYQRVGRVRVHTLSPVRAIALLKRIKPLERHKFPSFLQGACVCESGDPAAIRPLSNSIILTSSLMALDAERASERELHIEPRAND
jgi:hypothetical protein